MAEVGACWRAYPNHPLCVVIHSPTGCSTTAYWQQCHPYGDLGREFVGGLLEVGGQQEEAVLATRIGSFPHGLSHGFAGATVRGNPAWSVYWSMLRSALCFMMTDDRRSSKDAGRWVDESARGR